MPVVMHPDDPRAKIAVADRRYRARFIDPINGGNPEIESEAHFRRSIPQNEAGHD